MTDKTDPESDDIDAFLRNDASQKIRKPADDELVPRRVSSMPRTTDPVARFNSRVTHVTRNLNKALDHANEMSRTLGTDQELCDELGKDIDEWDSVIHDLEGVLPDLPHAEKQDMAENELHEDVAAAIASHIDTYVEAAHAEENHAQENNKSPNETGRVLLDQQVADAFDELAGESGNDSEGAHDDANDDADEDPTMNREQEELLQSLEIRESRIRDLESQLAAIESSQESSQADDANAASQSATIESDESGLHVNRLVVAINGSENLKYPLSRHIMTIGREPHNDIHVRSRYVSRFHARIVSDRDGAVIEDLDSRNGVSVNSRKVRRTKLKSGDLIDLGRVQLKYIDLMEGSASEGQA